MNKKKMGTVLILLGLFIPSILYLFTEPTKNAKAMQIVSQGHYKVRLSEFEIVFKKETPKPTYPLVAVEDIIFYTPEEIEKLEKLEKGLVKRTVSFLYAQLYQLKYKRIAIPYKYVMALGIVLVFAGAGIMVLSSNRHRDLRTCRSD